MIDVTLVTFECMAEVYHNRLESLIINTVAVAGVRGVSFEPELGRHYGDAHAALPEEHRQGISVAAIARTLQMNESTVRREVAALVKSGSLIRAGNGCRRWPIASAVSPPYADQFIGKSSASATAWCLILPPDTFRPCAR